MINSARATDQIIAVTGPRAISADAAAGAIISENVSNAPATGTVSAAALSLIHI